MKNLSWKASFKTKCDGTTSFLIKIKHKKTVCKVVMPDIEATKNDGTFVKMYKKAIFDAFGEKKGKKIAEEVMKGISKL